MDFVDEPDLSSVAFSQVTPLGAELHEESLLELTGDRALAQPPYETSLIRRVAAAWMTPLKSLNCEQVATLVLQEAGLEWLADPVLALIIERPTVECRLYPGDLSLAALKAHAELLRFAPARTREWLAGAFDWIDDAYAFDPITAKEAHEALAQARGARRLT